MKIIGITGTNGKTSTAFFIKQMLEGMGRKVAMIGTVGIEYDGEFIDSDLTTPAASDLRYHIEKMEAAGVEYLVMEVSSHSLVQDRVKGLEFEVGVFTNLTQDHLDYHGTMEEYKNAKRKILSMSRTMVFNVDDVTGEEFFHEYIDSGGRCLNVATKCTCTDLYASRIESSLRGAEFLLNFMGTDAHVKIPIPGVFSVYNVMESMATLSLLGFGFDEVIASVADIKPVRGRAQILDLDTDFTVMIDYAHTPDALENILSTIREFFQDRLVTVFGCGGNRDRLKRPLMGDVVSKYSDYIFLTSDNPRKEDPLQIITDVLPSLCEGGKPYRAIPDRSEAIEIAVRSALPGDLILLAGKGHETYQIIGDEKIEFDEEKIVRKALIF